MKEGESIAAPLENEEGGVRLLYENGKYFLLLEDGLSDVRVEVSENFATAYIAEFGGSET
jgi:hypothetical protein